MDFGNMLIEFRAKYGLTQKKAAELFGVSANTIHRYEKGTVKPTLMHRIRFENQMKTINESGVNGG